MNQHFPEETLYHLSRRLTPASPTRRIVGGAQPPGPPMTTIADTFQRALQSHQASRWAEAERLYGEVLAVEPGHIDALHLLGVLALQTGRAAAGAERIAAAIA